MNKIKVHPKISTSIILWSDDGNKEHVLTKGHNCEGSVIGFHKNQIWEVYPYKPYESADWHGACEYKHTYIRLCPNDFRYVFGDDIVERAMDNDE